MTRLRITDHALLRFLERAGGVDIEGLRSDLETGLARAHAAARSVTQGKYLIKVDGFVVIVKGDDAVTVVEAGTSGHSARRLTPDRDGA